MNLNKLRKGQALALDVICKRIRERENKTSIILPTRYGKTDVIRLAAYILKYDGSIFGSICLSPSIYLQEQIMFEEDIKEMAYRYELDIEEAALVSLGDPHKYDLFSNNEYLISMTMQAATQGKFSMGKFADSVFNRTGKPLLIFIDECHQTSDEKARGDLVNILEENSALVVLLTATAIRADGETIPGFNYEILKSEDVKKYRVTDVGDGIHNFIDVYAGTKNLFRIVADHETTFREAWDENPPTLCHLGREIIEVPLSTLNGQNELQKLSELSPAESKGYLALAIRHDQVIREAINYMLKDLSARKKIREDIAAIIFTGNDREEVDSFDNQHAIKIKEIILEEQDKYDLDLDIKIVTMKTEKGKPKDQQKKIIKKFCRNDDGDILIVKQMGGLGMDAPRAKVLVDLSSVRTVSSCIQRYMRVATPYEGIKTATVITLADPLTNLIWKQFVEDEGGGLGQWDSDLNWIERYMKPKPTKPQEQPLFIDGAELKEFDDTHGYIANADQYAMVYEFIDRVPEILNFMTKADLAQRFSDKPDFKIVPQKSIRRIDKEGDDLRKSIVSNTKDLTGKKFKYFGSSDIRSAPWIEEFKKNINDAKKYVGVDLSIDLPSITNIKTLKSMDSYICQRIHGTEHSQS